MVCAIAARPGAYALDPHKTLTQYTRTVWRQAQGLPQDMIRAIAQTSDGYLWLGTDEGLARFDGYEFTVFHKDSGELPSNSITALAAAKDGSLWIGTPNGLAHYRNKRFITYTTKDGLPDNVINALMVDHANRVWIVADVLLCRFADGRFTRYSAQDTAPLQTVRAVYEDRENNIWVAGYGGVVRQTGGKFVPVIPASDMEGDIVTGLLRDRQGVLWVAGSKGLMTLTPNGKLRRYDARDGLPDPLVRAFWEDRDGNLWAGTNGGLSRLRSGRFVTPEIGSNRDRDWVRSIYEDREGNLWVGMNSGLNRFRDDVFTMYTRAEGLPSDEPTTVYQDRAGRIWIGFHDSGLMLFEQGRHRVYTRTQGLPSNEIFSIRESPGGDLLISTREGLSRMRSGRFSNYRIPDPLGRTIIFDAWEDGQGRIWAATPAGLEELSDGAWRTVIPGGAVLNAAVVVLCASRDGSLWAGTYGKGLWHLENGKARLYTTADGLSSDQIRSLEEDRDGTLWVGTFDGGLNRFAGGRFRSFTARQGLLSDNISHVMDDGRGSLWLSTTRGICRLRKMQLRELEANRISVLTPVNYGVEDGLRSAQCSPGYPTSGGGARSADGRLWFPTSFGLAVLDPKEPVSAPPQPEVHLVDVSSLGESLDFSKPGRLAPGSGRLQFHYTAIHLSAPEQLRYEYRLDGLDRDWVSAGTRRVINYNSLRHGRYRFRVRAGLLGGPWSETSYEFELLPQFYETAWFLWVCAALLVAGGWALYQLRLRQIRGRFALVLEERARLAREIHDTLAQGFVGISSQLDAVAMALRSAPESAQRHLELARRMARHSLTEARRSVVDLRDSALDELGLPEALSSVARQWTAGSAVEVKVAVTGEARPLPHEMEQHLLRIAQEAVTNAMKHARAQRIQIGLEIHPRLLSMRVEDDGAGFEQQDAFSALDGHFGLLGMRERAERLGGELHLHSAPGRGTQVEVTVPLS